MTRRTPGEICRGSSADFALGCLQGHKNSARERTIEGPCGGTSERDGQLQNDLEAMTADRDELKKETKSCRHSSRPENEKESRVESIVTAKLTQIKTRRGVECVNRFWFTIRKESKSMKSFEVQFRYQIERRPWNRRSRLTRQSSGTVVKPSVNSSKAWTANKDSI